MSDGTTYPVAPGGGFIITRADHLAEMDRGNHDVFVRASTVAVSGRECLCGHACWSWQRECPRCGLLRQT